MTSNISSRFVFALSFILLTSCGIFPVEQTSTVAKFEPVSVSTESFREPSTPLFTEQSNTATPKTVPMEGSFLQLTYMLQEPNMKVGLYAVTLGCPYENPPCISEPELLFSLESINDPLFTKHSWSSDGSRVTFSLDTVGMGRSLYLTDSSGESITVLIDANEYGPVQNPVWSGSGSEITYFTCEQASCSIMTYDLRSSVHSTFFSNNDFQWSIDPSWMFGDSFMVFSSVESTGTRYQLFLSNAAGSQVTMITKGSGNKVSPAFSPDGEKILFIRYPTDWDGAGKLMTIDTNGINETVIFSEFLTDYSGPVWSQVGNWIAYNKKFDINGWDVYISKPDGTGEIQITDSAYIYKGLPSWRYFQ